jgi:hypothetical protein
MTITGNENHSISLAEASAWTKNYRDANPGQIKGHALGKNAISDILFQDNCVGLRVYYALDDSGAKQIIFVGIDADGNDLYEGKLAERTYVCPPDCGAANSLNS